MSDPVTYNFNLTTVPVLRNITISTINVLRTAKDEQSKSSLPADEQILDSTFGDILPFRVQPMLLANFSVAALEFLKLPKAGVPALRADFKTLDEMIIEFLLNYYQNNWTPPQLCAPCTIFSYPHLI
jgi:hypothetical protein